MKKLICYLTIAGNKRLSENGLFQIFKNLQKYFIKNPKNLIKLSMIFLIQVFKVNNLQKNKKFSVLYQKKKRIFLANKFLVKITKRNAGTFYKKVYREIVLLLINSSFLLEAKKSLQEHVIFRKHLFLYYR